jgi:hypothetical protein
MSDPNSTPLTRWAARNPRVRVPLIAAALFALWGLAGAVAPPLELLLSTHP